MRGFNIEESFLIKSAISLLLQISLTSLTLFVTGNFCLEIFLPLQYYQDLNYLYANPLISYQPTLTLEADTEDA